MLFRLALATHAINKPPTLEPSSAKLSKLARIIFGLSKAEMLDEICYMVLQI